MGGGGCACVGVGRACAREQAGLRAGACCLQQRAGNKTLSFRQPTLWVQVKDASLLRFLVDMRDADLEAKRVWAGCMCVCAHA